RLEIRPNLRHLRSGGVFTRSMRGVGASGDGADRRGHAQADAAHAGDYREFSTMAASWRGSSPAEVLSLPFRRRDHEAVEFVADLDLAGKPRIRPHVEPEIQHVL